MKRHFLLFCFDMSSSSSNRMARSNSTIFRKDIVGTSSDVIESVFTIREPSLNTSDSGIPAPSSGYTGDGAYSATVEGMMEELEKAADGGSDRYAAFLIKALKQSETKSLDSLRVILKEMTELVEVLKINKPEHQPPPQLKYAESLLISKTVLMELELLMNTLLWFLNKVTNLVWYWKEKKISTVYWLERGPWDWFDPKRKSLEWKIKYLNRLLEDWTPALGNVKKILTMFEGVKKREDLPELLLSSCALVEQILDFSVMTADGGIYNINPTLWASKYWGSHSNLHATSKEGGKSPLSTASSRGGSDRTITTPRDDGSTQAAHSAQEGNIAVEDLQSSLGVRYIDLVDHLLNTVSRLSSIQKEWLDDLGAYGCLPLSHFHRRWYIYTTLGLVTTYGAVYCLRNSRLNGSDNLDRWIKTYPGMWKDWILSHSYEPMKAIFDEIVHDKNLKISDKRAIEDSKESLKKQLNKFYTKKFPSMDPHEVRNLSDSMDVTLVTRTFELEMQSPMYNLISGYMGEVMLIQMSFIKKELLVAMGAIEELIKENHFNMQLMATVPAFILCISGYYLSKYTYEYFTKKKQTRNVVRRIRFTMRDIEKVLQYSRDVDTAPALSSQSDPSNSGRRGSFNESNMLPSHDLGKLVLLLHRLAKQIRESISEMTTEERERVEEDLRDLISDKFTVDEKVKTIQRMFRTYGFLAPKPRDFGTTETQTM